MPADAASSLTRFFDGHPKVLVLTGAGCSTGSGIPDYRDVTGAWRHRPPMSLREFAGSDDARRLYWARSLRGWPRVRDAAPNAAHAALSRLQASGRVGAIVTQNVDGLHQKAGSRGVMDLHGRLDVVECMTCGAIARREDVQALLLAWNPGFEEKEAEPRPDGDATLAADLAAFRVPDCRDCGGVLKPGVVFFGENVPRPRVDQALAALAAADALLVVGSSLMVYSGFRFVLAARALGRPVAAVNLGRTRADDLLALKVAGDCASVLSGIAETEASSSPLAGGASS
jgi:NAD-dependent SIR2 family protein deacetylase